MNLVLRRAFSGLAICVGTCIADSSSIVVAQEPAPTPAPPAPNGDAGVPDMDGDDAGAEPVPEMLAASSAAASGDGLEEIVVTAQRRRTNLQETPISITAMSGESLRERGAVDLHGVAEATPNMQLTTSGNGSGGSSFAQVFIRGVGQADFIITKDPGVGIYVDGVYLARPPGALLQLMDIERVEVLRGPQGTLFGKNTAGGAINVITKQPDGDFSGTAEVRGGAYGQRDLSGSFEAPLVDDHLFLRVSGMALHRDGYYERLQPSNIDSRTEDGNSVDAYSGRVTLRWQVNDDVDIVLAADSTLERESATDYQAVGIFQAPNIELYNRVVLQPQGQIYDARWIASKPWTTNSTWPSYNDVDVWGTSATINWDLGPLQLKSITAYRQLRTATKTDGDGTPFDIVASDGILVEQNQISEELQFGGNAWDKRLHWVVGLWYFQEHAEDRQSSRQLVGLFETLEAAPARSIDPPGMLGTCPADGSGPMTCLGGKGNMANLRFDQTRTGERDLQGRSYAAFGQAALELSPFVFTAGARISREEKDFTYFETRPLQNDLVSFDHVKSNPAWNVFTPKLSVELRFTPELMTYASYALGFKAGGVNGRPTRPDLFTSFGPEWLSAFELGAKSDWLDKRLRVNLALFYSIYSDIQITRNTVDDQGAFIRLEDNAGDAVIAGFELESTIVPLRGLNITAALGYTHFEFTSLLPQMTPPGVLPITLDNKLPFTPELTGNLGASYRISLGSAGSLTPRVDFMYSSGYYIDIDNTEAVEQGPYAWLNARLGYMPESAKFELFAAVTNLTNRAVIGSGVSAPANGSQIVSYLPPRMIYGGARFSFD
jgi:iron complex outermembrane receptor protein